GKAGGERLRERRVALARQRDYVVATLHMEREATHDRVARLALEIGELDAELAAQAARTRLAENGAGRARGLESVGFLSPAAADRERDAVLEHEGRLQSLRRTRMSLERERASSALEGELAHARAQAQLAALDAQSAAA